LGGFFYFPTFSAKPHKSGKPEKPGKQMNTTLFKSVGFIALLSNRMNTTFFRNSREKIIKNVG